MEQTNAASGGSNAQDFQPLTQNPQGNVGGGLQPNGATNDSIFNQPSANQQAFPQTGSLKVLNSGTKNPTGNLPVDAPGGSDWNVFTVFFIVVAVIIGGLLLMVKSAKPADKPAEKAQPTIPSANPATTNKKKKPKKQNKKKK